jgi:hypothetical protein
VHDIAQNTGMRNTQDTLTADWMFRPGMNSKQALAYSTTDPEHPVWCEHTHRTVDGAIKCAKRLIAERRTA